MENKKFRDLSLIKIDNQKSLVIACDSAAGIGLKENDLVKVAPDITAYFTASVSLMELISFGARPILLVNNLGVEMDPTGREIVRGIRKSLREANLDKKNILTGSTEENILTTTTSIGITSIGLIDNDKISVEKSKAGMLALVIGEAKFGNELLESNYKGIFNLSTLNKLKESRLAEEILPVGSKGILNELNQLLETNNLSFKFKENIELDLYKSAGPSTCAIISIRKESLEEIKEIINLPITILGKYEIKEG